MKNKSVWKVFWVSFFYLAIMSWGLPYWDGDFLIWFKPIEHRSFFQCLVDVLSPFSREVSNWGFTERPLVALILKILYYLTGYEAWLGYLLKCAFGAYCTVWVFIWGKKLANEESDGIKWAAGAALLYLLSAPIAAAHVWFGDFAFLAEGFFLTLTYVIFEEIQKMAMHPKLDRSKWLWITFFAYLGYKAKADVKLIPIITAVYVLLFHRKLIKTLLWPIGLMSFLAVPWGKGIFTQLPPFLPGSHGSEVGWMWQPARSGRVLSFIFPAEGWSKIFDWSSGDHALFANLGPFVLVFALLGMGVAFWKNKFPFFILIWFSVVALAVGALPDINPFFQIRYGLFELTPICILLPLFFQNASQLFQSRVWVTICVVCLMIQCGFNLNRSRVFRNQMGGVTLSTSHVYDYINLKLPNEKIVIAPDFRNYESPPNSSKSLSERVQVGDLGELQKDPVRYPVQHTYVISWTPSLWGELEVVQKFSPCVSSAILNWLFSCDSSRGPNLLLYTGVIPEFNNGEKLKDSKNFIAAKKAFESGLEKHPGNFGAKFSLGIVASNLRDWNTMNTQFSDLESQLPEHFNVTYNHAIALKELGSYSEAIQKFESLRARAPKSYPVLYNLFYSQVLDKRYVKAKATLDLLTMSFSGDPEVLKIVGEWGPRLSAY